ncbi:Galactokinase [Neolecta irregularis DAH-3]|uniref:Galactokinase n=1 Tax=Neolecta irregularis (strain DAH-3) TaxID=1198029 RepID=A0A1U7LUR1_NEOID|nr:Galactokinase [Neolecta irregularis DAH-3]|eukprot:OLL26251.1 Galactokinase [Neolecta irregularis DAH-3]
MAEDTVPFVSSLADIYSHDILKAQEYRWNSVIQKFVELYSKEPDFLVRSPGRVNLIGEHIDYSDFGVLPMAIIPDILIAFKVEKSSDQIQLHNTNPRFKHCQWDVLSHDIDADKLEWSNYIKAGFVKAMNGGSSVGMKCLVDGSIPTGAGLSSSAAVICSSALSCLIANGERKIDKRRLVDMAIVAEKLVGVNTGGMDQSASVFGDIGSALYIEFYPSLKVQTVTFPATQPEMVFVIANTLVNADKHDTAPTNYNLRVVETTLAAQILGCSLKLGTLHSRNGFGGTLREIFDRFFYNNDEPHIEEIRKLEIMCEKVKEIFPQTDGYTHEEAARMLRVSKEELIEKYMTKFPIRAESFQLRNRALHVFSEARRVLQFKALLLTRPNENKHELVKQLGKVMNESQDSCRNLYNCSCPEIDEIISIARKNGAVGSRLTGAGWGGCTVSLLPKNRLEEFTASLVEGYYRKRFPGLTNEQLKDAFVPTQPGKGSAVFQVCKYDSGKSSGTGIFYNMQ